MALLPVIMAGGSGTRLWPLSREQYPKQFLKLFGEHSLLQDTVKRAQALPDALPLTVLCGEPHRFLVAEQLRAIGVSDASIIVEPSGRNTAPAAAIASLFAKEKGGDDTLVMLLSADQVVSDVPAFVQAVKTGIATAKAGRMVTFGITPTYPATGYGYLKAGAPLGGGAFVVEKFIEKPNATKAAGFIKEGGYYWNGGLFLFPAKVLLEEMQRLEPAMLEACVGALGKAKRDLDFTRLDAEAFGSARSDSIDYAVMEKTDRIALVPLDAGWDDVGAWSFMQKLPADSKGNVTRGDVIVENGKDNLIHSEHRLVAAVGVKDHVIVETKDAVLVTTRAHAQDVKKVVAALKAQQRPESESHARVFRPWGSYETISLGPRFQVKRIIVNPGQKLSLQMHHKRAEHWVVVAGTARVTCGDKVFDLNEDQSTYIPLGAKHRLENPGTAPLELIEVQSGSYLGEDDIVRFDDVYGRAT